MNRSRSKSKRRPQRRVRSLGLEPLEQRRLLAATPMGVTPLDTGEFLLGTVAVTPVFFESDGTIDPQSQNWTPAEIDAVLAKIDEGVNWWSDTLDALNTVHSVDFIIDNTYALDPVETGYEPIDRISNHFNLYVSEFLTAQGFANVSSIEEGVQQFNAHQREQLGTDWAFTVFMVDSSDDFDGQFLPGGYFQTAFAYAGGLFMVVPSTRPASTVAHEMGHIFWARDEYPGGGSWTDRRGYYDAQNLNAADNPTPGFVQENSIMSSGQVLAAAYVAHESPDSTLAMIGWRDTDGDGVFDLADVPLDLQGEGYFDASTSIYHFVGSASAVPLLNQNSSGPQSDITFNRISQLQYRLDGGVWVTASQPDEQIVEFDLSLPIEQPFTSIQWRVVDDVTGVESAWVDGTQALPAFSPSSGSGLVFLDDDQNSQRDTTEPVLVNTQVTIRHAGGTDLVDNHVQAADYPNGVLGNDLPNVALVSQDPFLSNVFVGDVSPSNDTKVFQRFDSNANPTALKSTWTEDQPLTATFDSPVGEVAIEIYGDSAGSYARIEAMDGLGNLLDRTTSDLIVSGMSQTVRITDPEGRIESVRVLGHADTAVLIRGLSFGTDPVVSTNSGGGWYFENLPTGEYLVELTPELLIHQLDQASFTIDVTSSGSSFVQSPASRVDSPRYNASMAADVNDSGDVTALDALIIINDMGRHGSRILQPDEITGTYVDVTNDGRVTALDALRVLNELDQIPGGEGESRTSGFLFSTPAAAGAAVSSGLDGGLTASPPPVADFLPMSRCSGSLPSDYPLWGVLNSADSHRRSESIGTADADKSVYGPLQRVASHNISTFFAMPTTERTLDAELETAYGDGLILELDARLDLQLPE